MNAIEGIIFDLDGTLLDTADDIVAATNKMLTDYNYPELNHHEIKRHVSAGSRAIVNLAFKIKSANELEEKRALFFQYYDQQIQDHRRDTFAHPYPGILSLINKLQNRNIVWGIATNKPRPYTLTLLNQIAELKHSGAIVCPEDVKNPKPDPEALLLACKQAGCAPEFSLCIGDHSRDIEAGKKAGMVTVAAHYGYITKNDQPSTWGADLNINNIQQLHQWLEQNNWQLDKA